MFHTSKQQTNLGRPSPGTLQLPLERFARTQRSDGTSKQSPLTGGCRKQPSPSGCRFQDRPPRPLPHAEPRPSRAGCALHPTFSPHCDRPGRGDWVPRPHTQGLFQSVLGGTWIRVSGAQCRGAPAGETWQNREKAACGANPASGFCSASEAVWPWANHSGSLVRSVLTRTQRRNHSARLEGP